MNDVPKICALWIALMLIAGRASSQSAASGKDATTDSKALISEKSRPLDESNRIAELIKRIDLVENATNVASKGSDPFVQQNLFMDLITRADLAFEASGDGTVIDLIEPRHVRGMSIADLDRMLTNGAVRKELAVVVMGQWTSRVPTKEEAKMLEDYSSRIREGKPIDETAFWVGEGPSMGGFAFEMNDKLRKAGFKQVVFANKYNGMYSRMRVRENPTEERTSRERALLNSPSTNSAPHGPGK